MMKFVPPNRLYGCDIDSEAISWSKGNISGPEFTHVNPYPPTPYLPRTFDVVYGISVMTHLDEKTQLAWLEELTRITRPNAILALSIIGEDLRKTNMPPSVAEEFREKGFASFVPTYSTMLATFADDQYYQEAYHSLEYIAATWGRFFHVLECIETKHQDIIILKADSDMAD
jgi:2-polyprenyl-3-methyl-5-hydroxy-6-metoxy-1,4-benzoquinol methylase